MTFFYTNQQSARLMFYHDHTFGITRLNVYAGEAAGYLITDETEKKLVADRRHPRRSDSADHPGQDLRRREHDRARPTRRGTGARTARARRHTGDLWVPHVYVPAQNPAHPGRRQPDRPLALRPVVLAAGDRTSRKPPIANPYYDPINAPWEPPLMPATPNPSMGMETFNDTPLVNGTAYPVLDRGAQVVPLPHPERGQRPLLQPADVRGRPDVVTRRRSHATPRSRWCRRRFVLPTRLHAGYYGCPDHRRRRSPARPPTRWSTTPPDGVAGIDILNGR